ELADRALRLGVRAHLNERKPPGPSGRHVAHHFDAVNGSSATEQLLELTLTCVVRQISHVQFPTHLRTPRRIARPLSISVMDLEWISSRKQAADQEERVRKARYAQKRHRTGQDPDRKSYITFASFGVRLLRSTHEAAQNVVSV